MGNINQIPFLNTAQMIEVDRLMIEEYGILLIQMMENAGRGLAILARDEFLRDGKKNVCLLAGTGGNGGGAMVCARRLHNLGFHVEVVLSNENRLTEIPAHQLSILRKMGIPIRTASELASLKAPDLIIDGIIGYSLKGNPRNEAAVMIEWANQQEVPVLSLDTPSGIDLTTGKIFSPVIKAQATLTLALPKEGLFKEEVRSYRGDLYLADISVPPELYARPGLELEVPSDLFLKSDILKIDPL